MSELNESTVIEITEKFKTATENTEKVFEAGRIVERDAFWESFQLPSRRAWSSAFQYACWNDNTFYPKYDLVVTGAASSLFRYCGITDLEKRLEECGVILDTSGATGFNCAFSEAAFTALPPLDFSKCLDSGSSHGSFSGCASLKTIRKIIVSEGVALYNTFTNLPELENITFEGVIGTDTNFQWSKKLTRASIESIVNHLSDSAVGKTLTLSKAAVDEEFAFFFAVGNTSEEIPGTHPDNPYWWPLRNTKSNWEIAYV